MPKNPIAQILQTPMVPPKQTELPPHIEQLYQNWVANNKVPESNDYDMRGFFMGMLSGDPAAKSAINPSDNQLHFSDKWKLPNHPSFSNESMYSRGSQDPYWVQNPPPYINGTWAQSGLKNNIRQILNVEIPR